MQLQSGNGSVRFDMTSSQPRNGSCLLHSLSVCRFGDASLRKQCPKNAQSLFSTFCVKRPSKGCGLKSSFPQLTPRDNRLLGGDIAKRSLACPRPCGGGLQKLVPKASVLFNFSAPMKKQLTIHHKSVIDLKNMSE